MLKKILLVLGVILLLGGTLLAINYQIWSSKEFDALASGSEVAETDLGPIEYVKKGDKGPVVLFLHGTPGGYDQGIPEDPEFVSVTPSRPGYLKTPLDVGRTPAEQAKAYAALLDKLGIDSVIVMGASGGGPSAFAFAGMFPERTQALVAIEAVSYAETDGEEMPAFLSSDFLVWLIISIVDLLSDETAIGIMIPDPGNQQLVLQDPEKTQNVRSLMWSLWPPSLRDAGTTNDLYQFRNMTLPIEDITTPTLIIHGTADTNVDFSHAELLANTIPGAQLHAIKDADHAMPFTHAEEVQNTIADFMTKVVNQEQMIEKELERRVESHKSLTGGHSDE